MNRVSANEVRSFVLARLEAPLAGRGLKPQELRDDFDLVTGGVIDSLGLVELIAGLEQHLKIKIDFQDMDPESFTVIGPFCRYVEEKSEAANAPNDEKTLAGKG